MHHVADYLDGIAALIPRIPHDSVNRVAEALLETYRADGTIFVCGNGGSAGTASHLALDLAKGTRPEPARRRLRAMALTDSVPLLTAWGNDTAYEHVFSEQLAAWYRPGDCLIAISGSGNSANVVRAVQHVSDRGGTTCALLGYDGGKVAPLVTHAVVVPSDDLEKIEDCHMILCHLFTAYLRHEIAAP